MSEVIVVIGLPASGKSFYCKELNKSFCGVIVDDEIIDNNKDVITNLIEDGRDFIYADAALCNPEVLLAFNNFLQAMEGLEVSYIYFENDPEQCLINSDRPDRQKKKVRNYIKYCSQIYTIPNDVVPLKVWREND